MRAPNTKDYMKPIVKTQATRNENWTPFHKQINLSLTQKMWRAIFSVYTARAEP